MRWAWVLLFASACLDDFDVEGRTYPCRAPGDCAEGFECHPTRWVCVPLGSVESEPDAGSSRRSFGAACGADAPCDDGQCVDGYCCRTACTEGCHACDASGDCRPSPDGTDPAGDCANLTYTCAAFTLGLTGASCVAGANSTVEDGTCNGAGICRPVGCEAFGTGQAVSQCLSAMCLLPGACPAGAPVAQYDTLAELCRSGAAASCTRPGGEQGCCNRIGDCCPTDQCDGEQPCP